MATMKKPAKKVADTKMKDGGPVGKKKLMKVPYPKDKNMSSQDSASFKLGANMATGRGSGDVEGYTGITSNKYYEKGKTATKVAKASATKKKMKMGGAIKAKNGKSFPDLNKDGKITKADILKGRGVIAKKGASVRKAGLGDILGKVAGSGALGLAGMAANKLFGGKKKAAAPAMGAAPMGAPASIPAVAPMKKGGKIAAKKKMMKSGGAMKKCKYGCK